MTRAKMTIQAAPLALLLLGTDCSSPPQEAPAETATPEPDAVEMTAAQVRHGGVRWAPVDIQRMRPSVELPGQLVPDEDRTERVGAPAEGRVMSVSARPGDRVQRGQTLVVLQSTAGGSARADLVKAQSDVAAKRAALGYARSARERAERLLAAKAGAKQDLDRAQADEGLAASALEAAFAEQARARAAAAHLGVDASGDIVLRASRAGIVLARDAVPGAVVAPGASLVAVSDIRSLWLEVAAPDSAAGVLRRGASVRFTVPTLPGKTYEATVESVGGSLDASTRTLPVRARVDNRAGDLRPNMIATVQLEAGAETEAVSVPDAAVVLLDERPVLFVAKPDGAGGGRFERRRVEMGRKDGGRTLVIGGVRAGETVVTEGAFAVKSLFERAKMPAEG